MNAHSMNGLDALQAFSTLPRWVGWRAETRNGKPTKIPYDANTRDSKARANDPRTWATLQTAREWASRHAQDQGGIGIQLGQLNDDAVLSGIDLDSCRDPATGAFEPWAADLMAMLQTYCEVSPSGTGIKAFFSLDPAALPAIRAAIGGHDGKAWKRGNDSNHPPSIELYLAARYFTVTGCHVDTTPCEIRRIESDVLLRLITEIGPQFAGVEPSKSGTRRSGQSSSRGADSDDSLIARIGRACVANARLRARWRGDFSGLADTSRSGVAFALGAALKGAGFSRAEMAQALAANMHTSAWAAEADQRQFDRIFDRADDPGPAEAPKSSPHDRPPLVAITAADLFGMEIPPRDLALAPWLPVKGLAMIYGPRGIGKTHITLGAAYAIAAGGSFLRWQAPKPRKVVVLDGEMPLVVLQERLAAIAATYPTEPPDPSYLRLIALDSQERGLNLSDVDHQRELEAAIGDAEIILVDNIATLTADGKENEGESWLPVQQWALLQRRQGRTVLFIHHAGKGGQQRGTSRREDVLDTVISLRHPSDYQPDAGARFELHYEKSRGFHGEDAKPFEATLGTGGWTTRTLADADLARVAALTEEGLSVRDIAEEIGLGKSKVSRLQAKAREFGLIGRPANA